MSRSVYDRRFGFASGICLIRDGIVVRAAYIRLTNFVLFSTYISGMLIFATIKPAFIVTEFRARVIKLQALSVRGERWFRYVRYVILAYSE